MADYVVRLTGQDNLSSTVKQVKKELSDVGSVGSSAIDKINTKFNRITQSSAPLKRQLRDLQNLMAEMNFKGLANTTEFTQIAVKAGEIKDAIADASDATKRFSSDTMKLDAAIQAFQGVAAAGSIATGAMALFGAENQEAAKMIQKVQGALAILNGVQAIANTLNKDGALMQRISQIRMAANVKTTVADTVATTANSTAKGINTVAINANSRAQKTWNTTKAIGKALVGDWTGLLLVGVAGLTAYSMATNKSTERQTEFNNSVERSKQIQQEFKDSFSSTYAELMSKYTQLQTQYKKLKSEHEKTEWITNNRTEIEKLGYAVNSVSDADNVFINNTSNVVRAFEKRAEAAARAAHLTKLYEEKFRLEQERADIQKDVKNNANEVNRIKKQRQEKGTYTWGEAQTLKEDRENKEHIKAYTDNITKIKEQIEDNANKLVDLNKDLPKPTSYKPTKVSYPKTSNNYSSNTTKEEDKPKYKSGSLSDLEKQLSDLQQKLKDGLIPNDKIEETKIEIEGLKNDILKKKIELGIEVDPQVKLEEEAKRKANEEFDKFIESYDGSILIQPQIGDYEGNITVKPQFDMSGIENPLDEFNNISPIKVFDSDSLEGIENLIQYNDTLFEKIEETRKKLIELKNTLEDAGEVGSGQWEFVTQELNKTVRRQEEIKEQQQELYESANNIKDNKDKLEKQSDAWGYYSEMIGAATNATSILGDTQEAQMAQFALNTASIISNAVSTITAMNAEALAKGASSAFALPFPANLAAWATVATTIGSIFASLPKFAEGGIIEGNQHGDTILTRMNGGEMILNTRQQSNLFKAIDNGTFEFGETETNNSTINFRIKGSDLYGTLKNFSKTAAKTGKITGIK